MKSVRLDSAFLGCTVGNQEFIGVSSVRGALGDYCQQTCS